MWATPERSTINSAASVTLRYMSCSPVQSARMRGYMVTVNMFEVMCKAADYVGIVVRMYAEVVDVFTMTLLYRDFMNEKLRQACEKYFQRQL